MQDKGQSIPPPYPGTDVSEVDHECLGLKGPGFLKLYPRSQALRHLIHTGRAPYLFITVAMDGHR